MVFFVTKMMMVVPGLVAAMLACAQFDAGQLLVVDRKKYGSVREHLLFSSGGTFSISISRGFASVVLFGQRLSFFGCSVAGRIYAVRATRFGGFVSRIFRFSHVGAEPSFSLAQSANLAPPFRSRSKSCFGETALLAHRVKTIATCCILVKQIWRQLIAAPTAMFKACCVHAPIITSHRQFVKLGRTFAKVLTRDSTA